MPQLKYSPGCVDGPVVLPASCCRLVAAHDTDRESKDGLRAIHSVITHHWAAHRLTVALAAVLVDGVSTASGVNNMLRSCLLCMIETWLRAFVSRCSGGLCLAGVARFLARRGARVSGLFPALCAHSR